MSRLLIAVVSGKGSPGASTTAIGLALSWDGPVLLVDCDSRGGDMLWGYGQGALAPGSGLLSFQVNTRRSSTVAEALWPATVELGEDRWALPGLDESRQAASVDWSSLARALRSVPPGVDVIADCGVVPGYRAPTPVWTAADLVVLCNRSSLKSTRAALNAGAIVRSDLMSSGFDVERLVSVVVGAGMPYGLSEVKAALDPVAPVVGELPWEVRGAATLSDGVTTGRRGLNRLLTAAGHLGRTLQGRVGDGGGPKLVSAERHDHDPQLGAFASQSINGSMNGSGNGKHHG